MPSPGNGILRVDEKAGLWDVVGENQLLPRVHLSPLQLLISDETETIKALTQDGHVLSIHRVTGEAINQGTKNDRELVGFLPDNDLAATFGGHQNASQALSCHFLF